MMKGVAPVAERLRVVTSRAFIHSIISPLCLVWVRFSQRAHVSQAKFCLRVCQMVLSQSSPVFATYCFSYELKQFWKGRKTEENDDGGNADDDWMRGYSRKHYHG